MYEPGRGVARFWHNKPFLSGVSKKKRKKEGGGGWVEGERKKKEGKRGEIGREGKNLNLWETCATPVPLGHGFFSLSMYFRFIGVLQHTMS